MKVMKWLFGLAVAAIVIGILSDLTDPKPKSTSASITGSAIETAEAAEPPLPVKADALFRAYDDNEVAADQKYKGKSLLVTGTVQSIDKDFTDSIVVKLASGNPFMAVHAYLDDQHAAMAASLKKGAKVAWVCTGAGRLVGSPVLHDCSPKA
ncbi:OB-fold protein [Ralstonia wenshanensis]|uniref:OB-fold protein n=1 Tax=Ralstonia wenshanensis TaxID=2842456 RepID=UPI003D99A5A4